MKASDFREKFSNVCTLVQEELKKVYISVLQRGISAPQVIRKENRKAQIAQSRREPNGSLSFWWRAADRSAPKFHYIMPRRFCQVKNAKKMHKSCSQNLCILTIDFRGQVANCTNIRV